MPPQACRHAVLAITEPLIASDRDHATVGHNLRNDDDPARLAILNFLAKQSANR